MKSSYCTSQTGMSPSARKKKSSISGGAKKAIGFLLTAQLERTLCFFGAGGQVRISGIRNRGPLGVEQPPGVAASTIPPASKSGEISSSFLDWSSLFLHWVLLGFLVLLLLLVLVLLADGAIGENLELVLDWAEGFCQKGCF